MSHPNKYIMISKMILLVTIFAISKACEKDLYNKDFDPEVDKCVKMGSHSVSWDDSDYPREDIRKTLLESDSESLRDISLHHFDETSENEVSCSLCNSKIFSVLPTKVSANGSSCYIIQDEKTYKFSLNVNLCPSGSDADASLCHQKISEKSINKRGRCKQMYSKVKLLCYNPDKKKIEVWDDLEYPSSCICSTVSREI